MKQSYTLKEQRENYLLTLPNDTILKSVFAKKRHFEQLGGGTKAFGKWWDYAVFRIAFNLALPFIMLLTDLYLPLRHSVALFFHHRKRYTFRRMYAGLDRRLYTISKRAGLQEDDDVWFRLLDDTFNLPVQKKTVSVYDFVSFSDITKSAIQASLLHIKAVIQNGYDLYFLSYKAFDWCLTDFALRHVPTDVELIYSYICDRYAILVDKLPHEKKCLIQHGTMHFGNVSSDNPYLSYQEDRGFYIWNSLYKSSPTVVYCYTEVDEWALSHSVIANNPQFIHIGYGFKTTFKPSKKSVLIVANYYVFSKEEELILKQLQNLDIDVFLKNHPSHSNSLYDDYRSKYKFTFIEGLDTRLPAVDLLISYDSTLAYEYASIGTKVIYYGRFNISEIDKIVKSELNLD